MAETSANSAVAAAKSDIVIDLKEYYGLYQGAPAPVGPVPNDFTFNTPVGICLDGNNNLWICDTGNSRVVIVDREMKRILNSFNTLYPAGEIPARAKERNKLLMPFHLCRHPDPEKRLMYLTDLGNGRIVVFSYQPDGQVQCESFFGCPDDGINKDLAPRGQGNGGPEVLWDPNGVALITDGKDDQGRPTCSVYTCDEFYCSPGDGRGRVVQFTEDGRFVRQFRGIIRQSCPQKGGKRRARELKWPQGLSADANGFLYIANTGQYQVVRCNPLWPLDDQQRLIEPASETPFTFHSFGEPRGMSYLNVMRSVSVIGDKIFLPNQALNTISVYDLNTGRAGCVVGSTPEMGGKWPSMRRSSDVLYYGMDDAMLINPYKVCKGEAPDLFYISEPFTGRIEKVHIRFDNELSADLTLEFFSEVETIPEQAFDYATTAVIHSTIGLRRNQVVEQFNSVTSVTTLGSPPGQDSADPYVLGMPDFTRLFTSLQPPDFSSLFSPGSNLFSPKAAPDFGLPGIPGAGALGQGLLAGMEMVPQLVMKQYGWWFNLITQGLPGRISYENSKKVYNIDGGNWSIKPSIEGVILPANNAWRAGSLDAASYHPAAPLPGQICPGTPLLIVSNFVASQVTIYQFGLDGRLYNYGLPFGFSGEAPFCFNGPQGIAINNDGDLFVADSFNGRVSQWRILATGVPVPVRTFKHKADDDNADFLPTDVALDDHGRVFAVDQPNNNIKVFDAEGRFLWKYGRNEDYVDPNKVGQGDKFQLPTSLAIDGDLLALNDLVNRQIKLFRIPPPDGAKALTFLTSRHAFLAEPNQGGVWMPYMIHMADGLIHVPDSTFNVVQVFGIENA